MSLAEVSLKNPSIKFSNKELTKVYYGENMPTVMAKLCKGILSDGHICVSSFDDTAEIAKTVSDKLVEAGYRIKQLNFARHTIFCKESVEDLSAVDDDIRLFVAVGSGSLSDIVKYVAAAREMPCVIFATAPSTDSYFHDFVDYFDKTKTVRYDIARPKMVFFDSAVMEGCPTVLTGAGYGVLYSKSVEILEWMFGQRTSLAGEVKDSTIDIEQIAWLLEELAEVLEKSGTCKAEKNEKIAKALIQFGLWGQATCGSRLLEDSSTANHLETLIDEEFPKGIYSFFSAIIAVQIFSRCLKIDKPDLVLPPSATQLLPKEWVSCVAIKNHMPKFFDTKTYKLKSFLLGEFRSELLELADRICKKTPVYAREFRRLFDDAGYFFRSKIDTKTLLLAVCGSVSCLDEGMLGFFKQLGYLDAIVQIKLA